MILTTMREMRLTMPRHHLPMTPASGTRIVLNILDTKIDEFINIPPTRTYG